jgi:hypothetical protein
MTKSLYHITFLIILCLIISSSCSGNNGDQTDSSNLIRKNAALIETKFCDKCPTFVKVPKSSYLNRKIVYVSKFELTWNNYLASYDDKRCNIPNPNSGHKPPATNDLLPNINRLRLDWPIGELGEASVQCYLSWLQEKTQYQVALPTGDEWEWFARSGRPSIKFPWGNAPDQDKEALKGSSVDPANEAVLEFAQGGKYLTGVKIGLFPPSPWGIYDLMGNVRELTTDIVPADAWYQKHKDSKFAQYTRDKSRVLLKGSDRYSADWASDGIDSETFAVIWDGRYSTPVGIRIVLIERD